MSGAPICIAIWVENAAATGDLAEFCLPSLAQPGNLPWLLERGYSVIVEFYAVPSERARVSELGEAFHARLRALVPQATFEAYVLSPPEGLTTREFRRVLFLALCHRWTDSGRRLMIVDASRFIGDDSLRVLVTYAEKPGVVVGGFALPVEREAFRTASARRIAAGGGRIGNAALVDVILESAAPRLRDSWADEDRNATYDTGFALRALSDDFAVCTIHQPIPLFFELTQRDHTYFERFFYDFYLFAEVWPALLMAQNRWRMVSSSDLCCIADLSSAPTARPPALREGMRFNDEFGEEHLHGRASQNMLVALRRERLA